MYLAQRTGWTSTATHCFAMPFFACENQWWRKILSRKLCWQALQGLDKFQGRGSERTWLIGIMKHKIADHFRRAQREVLAQPSTDWFTEAEFFDTSDGEWNSTHAPADWATSPAQAVERSGFWKAFNDCLAL